MIPVTRALTVLSLGVVLLGAAAAAAQTPAPPAHEAVSAASRPEMPELVPDRPDFTDSSQVVPRGGVQFETGVLFEGDTEGGEALRGLSAPSTLFRVGLGHRIELRLGAEGLLTEFASGHSTHGFSDLEVAAKIQVFDQRRHGFDVAVLPLVSLPTGSSAFSSGGADPTLKFIWGRDLPAGFGVKGNVNVSSFTGEGGRFHQEAVSVSMDHGLAGGFDSYIEVFGLSRLEEDGTPAYTLDAGVAHRVGPNVQFDVKVGRGLSAASPDWFAGAGFAVRSPIRVR